MYLLRTGTLCLGNINDPFSAIHKLVRVCLDDYSDQDSFTVHDWLAQRVS